MTQQLVKKTFLFLSALLLLAANLNATVYTVNSTSDANTGAGNAGTFRYCIGRVNIGSGGDTIKFSVTGTIATSTSLPIIKAATIDGTSAPGYAGVPLIEVTDGATSAYGITIDADGVVITGLSITGFGNGIYINASGCTIQRCYIGITPNEVIQPNNIGLFVNGRVNKIGGAGAGNVICGNTSHGIYVFRDSNSIKGNYIGTDVTGTLDWGNAGHGIYLQSDSNMIGGSTGGERNLISGNGGSGISLSSGSYNVIKGNYIGTDFSGTVALGNTVDGITLGGSYNDIGGIGSGNRNIISGNSGSGISIQSFSNKIIDNYIGTDVNGVLDLGNTGSGITVSSSSNTIGGIAAGQGNLISGNNGDGITITSGGNVTAMYGNYIGTDKSGSVTIGNTGSGITIAANNCTIGGNTSGHRNLISGNAQTGISLTGSTNTVRGNYIGTDANGVADLGNTQAGISVQNTSNTIGGSSAGQGNLISGNNGGGVVVTAAAASIGIYGNRIGTDKSGSVTIGNTGSGITIASFNCTIGGNTAGHRNVISGNSQTGITLTGSSNAVMGNYIGTDANGVEDLGNTAAGIAIQNGGNIIGGSGGGQGNLISGNNGGGIGTVASASLTVIKGNYIGTDVSGTVAIGNTGRGIILNSSGNTIGGSTAGDRNIISGNSTAGMLIAGSNNNVMGNYVGTNATGTAAIKNNQDGISVAGTNNIIGGNSIAGEGNLLSGNGTNGIITTAANNTIKGNYIGTNAAGTVAVPNLFNGVRVQSVSTIVGGTGAGEGNLISGNPGGISCTPSGSLTVVQGNYIGTDISGTVAIPNTNGIDISSSGNIIGGGGVGERNIISGNSGNGVNLYAPNNVVKGNYIGTGASGTTALGNTVMGVSISAAANTIGGSGAGEGNVISGNNGGGIVTAATASLTAIYGNYIGTDITGTVAMGNTGNGIRIMGGNCTIGGALVGERNIISNNTTNGILINGASNTVKGNYIGTDANGTIDMGNGQTGINIQGVSNTIGGSAAGEGNLVSGNTTSGISTSAAASSTTVYGNYIGTNKTGTAVIPNNIGVDIASTGNIIGGGGAGERNIISGNASHGININAASNTVKGNYIGTDANGTAALGNTVLGINVAQRSNSIGGSGAGEGNIISGNGGGGIVTLATASLTVIYGNYIGTDVTGTLAIGNTGNGIRSFANCIIGGPIAGQRNIISNNSLTGISLSAAGNVVQGNYIGTDVNGTTDMGNTTTGISIQGASNTIGGSAAGEGNLISGNNGGGISTTSSASLTVVQGNYIGTDVTGAVALGNTGVGVNITAANCTIGGGAAGQGNLISGNTSRGITLYGSGSTIQGNNIGMNAAGTAAIVASGIGIVCFEGSHKIGGTNPGEGNYISGHASYGVDIQNDATGCLVQGNTIGLNAAGTAAIPNGQGVIVFSGTNTIGGTTAGARNIISGNTNAGVVVQVTGTVTTIQGNYIGTDFAGSVALGNGSAGVRLNASNSVVGGSGTGEGNIIMGNQNGVTVLSTFTNNKITGNSIYGNSRLGIDLGNNGVSLNDALDADSGPNDLVNYPVITSITQAGGSTSISGTYDGLASASFDIELFANTALEQSGYGEGQTYLATLPITTNGSGHGSFSTSVAGTFNIISATATTTSGSTSEFSLTGPAFINDSPQSLRVCEGASIVDIKDMLHVTDAQLGQTTTWYTVTAPASGTLTVTTATAASGSTDIAPGGTITYAVGAGYSGTDSFTIGATDGTSTVTMVVNVTVDPLPVISAIGNNGPICANNTLDLTSTINSGTAPLSYEWSGPSSFSATVASLSITNAQAPATGVYTLIVTGQQNCTAIATTSVTVHPVANIDAISASTPICEYEALNLNATVTGGIAPMSYNWSGPNSFSSTLEDPLVTSTASISEEGVYTLTATDANSCVATGINTVTVTVNPLQPIVGETSVLFGQTITLSDPVPGGRWSTPTPWTTSVNAATGLVKGVSAGTSVISYTTAQGCVATHTVAVLSGINACAGQSITLSDGGRPGGTWSSANGSIAIVGLTTGVVTGVNPGRVAITYRGPSAAPVTYTVTVNPLAPTSSTITRICQGQSLTLTNSTVGGGTWYSGNTSTAVISSSGVVTGTGGGTVVVYFTPVAGCVTTKSVTINPVAPITGALTVCVGQTTSVNVTQTGGNWSTSTGALANVSNTGIVTGVSAGQPRVSYIWPTGCYSTATVTVYPLSPINTISNGRVCEGYTITYTNATPVPGVWTTSNTNVATITTSGVLTGVVSGSTTIHYTTAQGCVATRTTVVNPVPAVSGAAAVCAGQTIMLSSSLPGGTWSTSTGQATVTNTGVVKGISSGGTRISYILPTGCYDYTPITVHALSPIMGGTPGICASGSMTLANTTNGGGVWSSSNTGAATVSTTGFVKGVGAGSTVISFTTNTGGCVTTRTVTVNACRESGPTTTVAGMDVERELRLYPNPNSGQFVLAGSIADVADSDAMIEIVNMAGQVVYKQGAAVENGSINKQVALPSNLANGMYQLNLITTGGNKPLRFVVER